MTPINVTIISQETLTATGLRCLLRNLFDIDARIVGQPGVLKDSEVAATDLFVTDAETFAAAPGFFIQRRPKLAIIGGSDNGDDNIGFFINRFAGEKQLIRHLSEIVEAVDSKRSEAGGLSQREIEVLCLLARGLTNKEIADRLCISTNTVLSHRKNISAKLGIKSLSGLSVYAMMNGYINDIPHQTP